MGDEGSSASAAPAVKQQTTQDLLADIFGSSNDEVPAAAAAAAPTAGRPQASAVDDIMGLFGGTSLSPQPTGASSATQDLFSSLGGGASPQAPSLAPAAAPARAPVPTPSAPQPIEAYNANGLRITLTAQRDNANKSVCNILAKFTTTASGGCSNVNFQAAVPKTQKLQMLAMSNTDVEQGKTETQQLRVMVSQPGVSGRVSAVHGGCSRLFSVAGSRPTEAQAVVHCRRRSEAGPNGLQLPAHIDGLRYWRRRRLYVSHVLDPPCVIVGF